MSKLKWTKNCPSLQMPLFSKILLLTISSILVTKIREKLEYRVSSFLLINVFYIRIMLLPMKNTPNTQNFLILVYFFPLTCTFNYTFIRTEIGSHFSVSNYQTFSVLNTEKYQRIPKNT